MEAYFVEDKKVLEWVDLIIEKLFTVCLLNNEGAPEEFEEGAKTIYKIAMLLQSMSPLPPETLLEGIRQLIQQRLPDDKIMNHFPNFNKELNNMMCKGLTEILPSDLHESYNPSCNIPTSKVTLSGKLEPNMQVTRNDIISINDYFDPQTFIFTNSECEVHLSKTKTESEGKLIDFDDKHCVVNLSATIIDEVNELYDKNTVNDKNKNATTETQTLTQTLTNSDMDNDEDEGEIFELKTVGAFSRSDFNCSSIGSNQEQKPNISFSGKEFLIEKEFKANSNQMSAKQSNGNSKRFRIPDQAIKLQSILTYFYPESKIKWNINLSKYTFLAQVQDLLVYIKNDSEQRDVVKEMTMEGWKVLCCSQEDLNYPRRLEREIKSILRKSRK